MLQIQKYAQYLFNCLPSFFSFLFYYACRGRALVLPRIYTVREFGSKQNWLKLDDALRGVNLVFCLDLIRSVLKEGEHFKTFAYSESTLMMWSSSACGVFSCLTWWDFHQAFKVQFSFFFYPFLEYYIKYCINSEWGRRSWEVVVIDLYFCMPQTGIRPAYLQIKKEWTQKLPLPYWKCGGTSTLH